MLEKYKESQDVVYNILENEIKNECISHAYLIDENNNVDAYSFVLDFVKEILCHKLEKNDRINICRRIDEGNYPELRIIKPDGMLIKKQQIIDLQKELSLIAVEGSKRIYIIRDADKMRSETANSMLKFLEEPQNDLIAILMTNNINGLLPTIISRCQILRLNSKNDSKVISEFDELAINFIESIEREGIKTIMREQELIFNTISVKERDKFVLLFDAMIDVYYKFLKRNTDEKIDKKLQSLYNLLEKKDLNIILDKINFLVEAKDRIKNNVNVNLLVDNVIVKIGG